MRLGRGFFCTPLFLAGVLGRAPACACSARIAPPPIGVPWDEVLCGVRRRQGFSPPLFFLRSSWPRGGGLWVWFPALLCCGSVVAAVACLGLGQRGLRPPSPLHFGFFSFCCVPVRVAGGLPPRRWGCAPACLRCLFLRPFNSSVVVVGHRFLLGVVGLGRGGSVVSYRRAPWVSNLLFPGWGGCPPLRSGCAASRLCDCPPRFFSFR